MRVLILIAAVISLGLGFRSSAETITLSPSKTAIVLDKSADNVKKVAAQELAKHLKLITGKRIPVINDKTTPGYKIYVGICPAEVSEQKLKPEESCYKVTPKACYIYGYDKSGCRGTELAVYSFLDRELGVKWLEPGDAGVVFKPAEKLTLKTGSFDWIPKLSMRGIRSGYGRRQTNEGIPEQFHLTPEQQRQKKEETLLWLRRMRMGKRKRFGYGHAFTRWWDKYGKTHPEYFAVNKYGKRAPWDASRPDRIKMCISNPELHKQIVDNWLKSRRQSKVINVCENDSGGYCRCPKCRALDVPRKGEKFGEVMTDRYIYFANHVQRLARKHVPDAQAVMYAYSVYRFPPRKVKVDKGVILGFVPKLLRPLDELDAYYKSWHKVGARELFLRPNDMHVDAGLPMGFEKKMFDNFKICMKYGAFGSDYDSLHNYWPSSGFANYVIARAVAEPDKSFEYWENEYCNCFGAAANDIKKYFKYWREEVWDKRLMADRETILKKGRYGNFRRGLMWNFPNYYKKSDFDRTDAILKDALSKKLSKAEHRRVETLMLANQHARLIYNAIKAKNARPGDAAKIRKAAMSLLNFRIKNKDRLNYDWRNLFKMELSMGDICALKMTASFDGFLPVKRFERRWYFQIDPENVGLKEKWQDYSYSQIKATWDRIDTAKCWEQAKTHPELMKKLKRYDGIAWYAQGIKISPQYKGKKLYLLFGAVDESCWVYVNGKEAGKHLFKKPDDWKTPFKIRIDQILDWTKKQALVTVRVEDKAGAGGIWQPVWLVTE